MKHFFFPYDESSNTRDRLNELLDTYVHDERTADTTDDMTLKAYYDITDIIYDKRFDKSDEQLLLLYKKITGCEKTESDSIKDSFFRLQGLELLWKETEKQYRAFIKEKKEIVSKKLADAEQMDRQYETAIRLALYHLVRGNLCSRISLYHYEHYDLKASDEWAAKGIEIFWHGKNLLASLRDSAVLEEDRIQADLYLRLTKLNLAKYYRDYARKNRRSDFDAALDEFKQVRHRVEEEYGRAVDSGQKRQYALIWMDAIINIIKIHRRKYQINLAREEMMFLYSCLKTRLQERNLAFQDKDNSDESMYTIQELLEKADQVILEKRDVPDIADSNVLEEDVDLPELGEDSFKKFDDLNTYDQKRFFLLVLLELARILRDLHLVSNYRKAMAVAIIADQWSYALDKSIGYTLGHNIDAFVTISSSLRKYIKFENTLSREEPPLKEVAVKIDKEEYRLFLENPLQRTGNTATLSDFIKELNEFKTSKNVKSEAEVAKWHCLYQQKSKLLKDIEENVGANPLKERQANCQLEFLRGLAVLHSKNYGAAAEIFIDLLKQNEKEMRYIRLGTLGLKVRYLLADCYMSMAEFSKAEKILQYLHDSLAIARKSRISQGATESTDAEPEARVEIDLGYCYMQRGAYKEAIEIYRNLYGKGELVGGKIDFGLKNVKQQRRIMGLNNYASCCIFSANDDINREKSEEIKVAEKIFRHMNECYFCEKSNQGAVWYDWDPETNLLKGYYTLCTGIEPGTEVIADDQFDVGERIGLPFQDWALLKAFPYFRKACGYEQAFPSRYDLLSEKGIGNKARYRNEVERISVYIISLVKLNKLYLSNRNCVEDLLSEVKQEEKLKAEGRQSNAGFEIMKRQIGFLTMSKQDLERFLLNFPANYKISLKAAIALAEWLLDSDKMIEQLKDKNKTEYTKMSNLQNQLYRSFSYITIYEERGAGVFNALRNNGTFRFFNSAQRGKFCALLLAMYKPIKELKEDCCFHTKDKEINKNLVHYTSMETLKNILTEESKAEGQAKIREEHLTDEEQSRKDSKPRFRINNCGYMNDVFEGKTFLKIMDMFLSDIVRKENAGESSFVEKYFPQINRSHEDLLPSGSNIYIGSLSVKADSFPMWAVYSKKETGCNIEFGDGFFDIYGIPYQPRALRDYMLSKYTDQDYPLYSVQYIGSEFEESYGDYRKSNEDEKETIDIRKCKQGVETKAIHNHNLFRILQQIALYWIRLDEYLEEEQFRNAVNESKDVIRAFAADRINEIRFLFKDADYEYEGEVRVIYTDSEEHSDAKNDTALEVPGVYVDIERELKDLTIRLGSRIEDATVDKYVTWLKHTKRVKKVELAKQNRYTT